MLERYHANAEERRAAARAWKAAHREHVAKYIQRWSKEHRPQRNNVLHNRAERMRGSVGVTRAEWLEIREFFGGRCAYCLQPANSIDHVVPIARGGRHDPSNVVPACMKCNQQKGPRTPLQWLLTQRRRERS